MDFPYVLFALSLVLAVVAGVWFYARRRVAAAHPLAKYRQRLLAASGPGALSLLLVSASLLCAGLYGVSSWEGWRVLVAVCIGASIGPSLVSLNRMTS